MRNIGTELTNDSDALICILYKHYLSEIKSGASKKRAKHFKSSRYIHENMMPKWSFDNVDETCRELDRAGLLEILYADAICYNVWLNDKGIIYMENRFANSAEQLLDYMGKIKTAIPFL